MQTVLDLVVFIASLLLLLQAVILNVWKENALSVFVFEEARGEYLMEVRNSVWKERYATVCRTATKMNAHFVPRFSFVCGHSEHSDHWLARSACWTA